MSTVQIKRKLSETVVQFLTEPVLKVENTYFYSLFFVLSKGKLILDLFGNCREMALGMNKNVTNMYFCRMVGTKESQNNGIAILPYLNYRSVEKLLC